MGSAGEAWLTALLLALFGLLFFLRVKFPKASKGSETAVLLGFTVVFFSICNFLLAPSKPSTGTIQQVFQAQGPRGGR